MDINKGDLVSFKNGLYPDENGAIYMVIEVNGDRVVIELVNTTMLLRPQSVAKTMDLVKVEKQKIGFTQNQ